MLFRSRTPKIAANLRHPGVAPPRAHQPQPLYGAKSIRTGLCANCCVFVWEEAQSHTNTFGAILMEHWSRLHRVAAPAQTAMVGALATGARSARPRPVVPVAIKSASNKKASKGFSASHSWAFDIGAPSIELFALCYYRKYYVQLWRWFC